MQASDPVLRHAESPRGPELREPARFLAALLAGLPPGYAKADTVLRLEFDIDVDATGTVTKVTADAVSHPQVRVALIETLTAAPFHPAWRDGASEAVSGLHMTLSVPVRASGRDS